MSTIFINSFTRNLTNYVGIMWTLAGCLLFTVPRGNLANKLVPMCGVVDVDEANRLLVPAPTNPP